MSLLFTTLLYVALLHSPILGRVPVQRDDGNATEVPGLLDIWSNEIRPLNKNIQRSNSSPSVGTPIPKSRDPSTYSFDYVCTSCILGAEILLQYHRMGWPPGRMISVLSSLCSTFKIQAGPVCDGMIASVGEQLFAVFDLANETVSPEDVCGMVYGGPCSSRSKRLNNWSLDIPDLDVDPPTPSPTWPVAGAMKTEKILHLTDTHIQLNYEPGMSNTCHKPVCCSSDDGNATSEPLRAGRYGDYNCDLPKWTFEEILRQANITHPDIKYILLTGDFPAHDVWRQNRSENLESIRTVVRLIQEYFPTAKVFPSVGNHESFPVNMFPDPSIKGLYSPSWLYANLAEIYQQWLPTDRQQKMVKDGGYFSAQMRRDLRVISINTNFCNNFNFWLLLNFADPHNHLYWIYKQLHKAELANEKVLIIGHIPPGSDSCLDRWSKEFSRLVYRFRNTISGLFFGHTHFDEFKIFFAPGTLEPVNVAYLAPSQTPHDGLNPAYRIYILDGDYNGTSGLLVDHQTYWLNLTKANENEMEIELEYSAINNLKLENMSPQSWKSLVFRLAENDSDFDEFLKYHVRMGPYYDREECRKTCKENLLCSLVTSVQNDQSHCKQLKKLIVKHYLAKTQQTTTSWWDYIFSGGKLNDEN